MMDTPLFVFRSWLIVGAIQSAVAGASKSCAEVAEQTSLLQAPAVHTVLAPHEGKRPSADFVAKMEETAKRFQAHGNRTGEDDAEVQAVLDALDVSLNQFQDALQAERAEADSAVQDELQLANDRVADVGEDDESELLSRLAAAEVSRDQAHTRKNAAAAAMEEVCGRFHNHIAGLEAQCNAGTSNSCSGAENFLANYDAWRSLIEIEGATINSEREACNAAVTELQSHEAECGVQDGLVAAAQGVVEEYGLRCGAYESQVQSLETALEHANNQVRLLRQDFVNVEHARCIHGLLGRALRDNTALGNLEECANDDTYAISAAEALPLINADAPSACEEATTTVPTTTIPATTTTIPATTTAESASLQCLTITGASDSSNGVYRRDGDLSGRPKFCREDGSRVLSLHGSCSGWMSVCRADNCVPASCGCRTRQGGVPMDEHGNPRAQDDDAIYLWPHWGGALTHGC